MSLKKILGWVFIVLAAWISLAALTQLLSLAKGLIGVYVWITRGLDAARAGEAVGHILFWVLLVAIIVMLWRSGRKMVKEADAAKEGTG